MALYTNTTRFPAIVTVRIDTVLKANAAIRIGLNGANEEFSATPGFFDFFVPSGSKIELINETIATLWCVRSAP